MTAATYPIIRRLRRILRSRIIPGTLEKLSGVYSPELGNTRDVYVYLPPGYDEDVRRYPVVYMQDGQNLFDTDTGFAGSWHAEEAAAATARLGQPAILVGVANAGVDRIPEYSPFNDATFGVARGDLYLDFLIRTLKPIIDKQYRTLRDHRWTGIAGSSMGGLISFYAAFTRADIFGFAGALSPSFWFADNAIFPVIEDALERENPDVARPRIYLDVGRYDGPRAVADAQRMRDLLVRYGYRRGADLRWVEDPRGAHQEASWARRFRKALPALLASHGPAGTIDMKGLSGTSGISGPAA